MNPKWSPAVDAYMEHVRGNNASPATLETYRTFLDGGRARAFREAHGIVYPHEFDAEVFEAMKREFRADGLKPTTVADYVRMWRQFAKFCMNKGWGVKFSTLQVANPRVPNVLPTILTDKQIEEILAACSCERDRMLVKFGLQTGMRLSEIARAKLDDIEPDPKGWLVRVRQGKGAKDRVLPLPDAFADELGHFLRLRPRTDCRALFLQSRRAESSEGADYAPLRSNGIYQILRRLSQKTGIKFSPHTLRHTCATKWAADGVSPFAIQRALGHSTPAMTNRYVSLSAADIVTSFRALNDRIRERGTNGRGVDELALSLLEGVSARDLITLLMTREHNQKTVGAK